MVLLAQARIGAELKAAQERGDVATDGKPKTVRTTDGLPPPTHADLGIPRQRAAEMKQLATAGETRIRDEVARANAEHGKRREPGDYRRAYQLAIKHNLAPDTDSEAVAALLSCTERWARELTASARERERILRDEAIQRERKAGKTVREVSDQMGVSVGLVSKVAPVHEWKPSEREQNQVAPPATPDLWAPDPEDDLPSSSLNAPEAAPPTRAENIRANLAEMASPRAQRWHRALVALQTINAQASVQAMLAAITPPSPPSAPPW